MTTSLSLATLGHIVATSLTLATLGHFGAVPADQTLPGGGSLDPRWRPQLIEYHPNIDDDDEALILFALSR